ncbi:hypothetical protein D3C80_1773920 [compost metagenome]
MSNYGYSGWLGKEKKTYYPMITWTAPTQDVNNNPLIDDFGGYTIYRNTAGAWYPIASIKSYSAALGRKLNYFYDYSLGSGATSYKIVAVNRTGQVSAESSVLSFVSPESEII